MTIYKLLHAWAELGWGFPQTQFNSTGASAHGLPPLAPRLVPFHRISPQLSWGNHTRPKGQRSALVRDGPGPSPGPSPWSIISAAKGAAAQAQSGPARLPPQIDSRVNRHENSAAATWPPPGSAGAQDPGRSARPLRPQRGGRARAPGQSRAAEAAAPRARSRRAAESRGGRACWCVLLGASGPAAPSCPGAPAGDTPGPWPRRPRAVVLLRRANRKHALRSQETRVSK